MRQRNKQIQVRITEEEQMKIKRLAEKSDCKSLTDYLIDKAIKKEIVEFDLQDINEGLAKIGGELNHLVMLCHQGLIERVDLTKFADEIELLRDDFNDKLK